MTDAANLEAAFRAVVEEEDDKYRAARTSILAHDAATLMPFLEARQTSPDWKTALAADTLIGWLTNRERFDRCSAAVAGELLGTTPLTGSFPAQRRISAIVSLGKAVTPRLLEMLRKTHEPAGDEVQVMTILGALARLDDPRVVVPIMDAVTTSRSELIRELSASALGELGDRRAIPLLLRVLRATDNSDMLRAAAAMSLGALGAKEAIPDLRAIVLDQTRSVELRKAAATALADFKDDDSVPVLLEALCRADDLPFQLILLDAIGKIGDAAVIDELREIESGQADEPVREAAQEARDAIEERLSQSS